MAPATCQRPPRWSQGRHTALSLMGKVNRLKKYIAQSCNSFDGAVLHPKPKSNSFMFMFLCSPHSSTGEQAEAPQVAR